MLTQTRLPPPPGAGVDRATASVPVEVFAEAGAFAAGVGVLFDLKKSERVLCGDGDALAAGEASAPSFFFRDFLAGDASAVAGLAAGEASAASFFFRDFLAGDASAAALASGEAAGLASAFL